MDEYKKIIKRKNVRFGLLYVCRIIPDKWMVKLQYRIKFRRKLNLKDPKRFTEKMQWYKLYYHNPLMVQCADKYMVREYVKSKGLEHILNELYAVYDKPSDIDFADLPDRFVLKLSNGSGTNLICRDKSKFDEAKVIRQFKEFEFRTKADAGREWPYMKSKPVIVAEKLLEDERHINNAVNDYKIFCFNGKPKYVICISNRYTDKCNHLVYTTNWEKVNVASEGADLTGDEPRPENLAEMLQIAEKLSADFLFARIDLYSLEKEICFGEITFFPWSGYMEFEPDSFDFELGKRFELPQKLK